MNTDHDLIYGAYKISEIAEREASDTPRFHRNYNRIDMAQLANDIWAQNWSPIYTFSDPVQ
jgi:hypothetical protein